MCDSKLELTPEGIEEDTKTKRLKKELQDIMEE